MKGGVRIGPSELGGQAANPRRKGIMRLIVLLLALFGGFILVAMVVAPQQPGLRSWYLQNACPYLDQLSADICASMRREAGGKV
jgi:hypothetical protein